MATVSPITIEHFIAGRRGGDAERANKDLFLSERFKSVKAAEAEKLLESLGAVGVAVEVIGPSGSRGWRLLGRETKA